MCTTLSGGNHTYHTLIPMLFQNKIARFKLDPPKLADKTYIYEWISFKNMIYDYS